MFLGHLDFQRQLQLALRRSGLPAAYSRGYHPHPLMKFGPPLPVGVAGLHEILDMAFECQVPGLINAINRTLPEGLRITGATIVGGQTPRSIDQIVQRFDYRVNCPDLGREGRTAPPRPPLWMHSWPVIPGCASNIAPRGTLRLMPGSWCHPAGSGYLTSR